MRNLRRFLRVLTGGRVRGYLMREANDLHSRTMSFTGWMMVIGLFAIILNLVGLKVVNFYLAVALNIVFLAIAIRPHLLLYAGIIGVVANKGKDPFGSGTEMIKKWLDIVGFFLLYLTIFLLASGIFSYGRNPGAIVVVVAGLLLLFWIDKQWGMTTKFHRKLIYVAACSMVVIGLASFVPRPAYVMYFAFSPFDIFSTSEVDEIVSNIEELEKRHSDRIVVNRLKAIERKLDKGATLTTEEQKFWEDQKTLRDKKNVPVQIKNRVAGLLKRDDSTPTATPAVYNVVPQVSKGWRTEGADLVADLQPGEEIQKIFYLPDGVSTPNVVIPTGNYCFSLEHLQTIIIEEGAKKTIVHPQDHYDMGAKGEKRFRATALKGGATVILNVKRNI